MKRNSIILSLVMLLFFAGVTQVQAASITGDVLFGGIWEPVGDLPDATGISITGNQAIVLDASGSFDLFINAGDVAAYNSFTFDPFAPINDLWSVGGFTFDLNAITSLAQQSNGILITGTGVASGNGFDPTLGAWSFSGDTASSSSRFAFSSTTSPVPEPGSMILIGTGLLGLALGGRKLRKK